MQQQNTPRVFTRADVERFFNDFWGKMDEPHNELRTISLLSELTPPCWQIEYKATYQAGTPYEHTNYYELLVIQKRHVDGQPYLNLPEKVELPEGLTTVAEEDEEAKRREQAKIAKYLKRGEQSR